MAEALTQMNRILKPMLAVETAKSLVKSAGQTRESVML
jgi:hypothetical protein